MDSTINTTFLDSSKPFWSVSVLEGFLEFMEDIIQSGGEEIDERSFKIFEIKINQAANEFFHAMKEMQLIMNCRTKCDSDSDFGGSECAKFMSDVIDACSEYIKTSNFLLGTSEEDLGYVIRGIKKKAIADRALAMEFEKSAKKLYLSEGIDKTMEIFKSSGYFNPNNPINSINDIKNLKKNIISNKG